MTATATKATDTAPLILYNSIEYGFTVRNSRIHYTPDFGKHWIPICEFGVGLFTVSPQQGKDAIGYQRTQIIARLLLAASCPVCGGTQRIGGDIACPRCA